jgi:diguanylate cyclase (GGDEF)-like protein
VDDYLIKPPDPLDLRTRIEMSIKRAQYSHYLSPLTGLPGVRLIEEAIQEKIAKEENFSFGHIDIDNFKCFNDVYGYFKGDKVIMQTAYILYTVIKKIGNKSDIIGHIGGDDFVFVTTPDKYKEICQYFIVMFDNLITLHYPPKDRKEGYITAKDRTNKVRKMPLMSVTVAVVNKTKSSELKNIIEINEKLVEIKRYLKTLPGSKFMADRRSLPAQYNLEPQVYKKEMHFLAAYKPLGQILLDNKLISDEQLEEALSLHWKRGIILGEILKELGYLKEEELLQALETQKTTLSKIGEM